MSKFNQKNLPNQPDTLNKSGIPAFSLQPKEELVMSVLTSFFGEQKFYGDNSKRIVELAKQVCLIDPIFVMKLSNYARREMNMRSISHVLNVECAQNIKGNSLTKKAIAATILRPDDLTETMAYQINTYGKPIPNSLKKGLATAFPRFNEFTLSKYNGGSKQIKLKDIINLVHVVPQNEKQAAMYKRLLEDNLQVAQRWETEVSAKGNTAETWQELLAKNQLGYMALLRNLRNILQSKPSDEVIDQVVAILTDREKVRASRQLPFRFYSAYKALRDARLLPTKIYDALQVAIEYSVDNLPRLKGKSLIVIDVSGSMRSCRLSEKSEITCDEIACTMAAIAHKMCDDATVVVFDTSLREVALSTKDGILTNIERIPVTGGGTNIRLPLEFLLEKQLFVDRIVMFSDNEINAGFDSSQDHWSWASSSRSKINNKSCQQLFNQYLSQINPKCWLHAIDLVGYGTVQFKGRNVNLIAGWNDRVLEFTNLVEEGTTTLLQKISDYEI